MQTTIDADDLTVLRAMLTQLRTMHDYITRLEPTCPEPAATCLRGVVNQIEGATVHLLRIDELDDVQP